MLVEGDRLFPPLGVLLELVGDPLSRVLAVVAFLAGGKLVVVDLK